MPPLRALLFGIAMTTALYSAPLEPLGAGETYTYRVSWGLFLDAGQITLSAANDSRGGAACLRISTHTSTRGTIRFLYPFDGDGDFFFSPDDGRLLEAQATTRARKNKTNASILFDYTKSEAAYTDHLQPGRNSVLAVPEGQFADFITTLIQARHWNLAPGQSKEVNVLFDNQFYHLNITAERIEKITTAAGEQSALLLIPRMIGKPKGMFRKGGEVHVWLADDAGRLPLRFEVKLPVGTAVALLTAHTEPSAAPAASPADVRP